MQATVINNGAGKATAQALNSELLHSQDVGIIAQTLVQWDGVDGAMSLNNNGLGGVDLTQGGTQNAFAVTVDYYDHVANLIFRVYSGATRTPPPLPFLSPESSEAGPIDLYIPFGDLLHSIRERSQLRQRWRHRNADRRHQRRD